MGKGKIISGGTDGKYILAPDYDTNKLENEIVVLGLQIAKYDTTLFAELDAEIAAINVEIADWDDNIAQVDAELELLDPFNPDERAEWDAYMVDKNNYVTAKNALIREKVKIETRKKMATAQKAEATKRKAKLEALLARLEENIEVWCADCSEDLQPDDIVGTIEVPNELNGNTIQIRPGYQEGAADNAAWNEARDGQLCPVLGQSPSGAFYNLAMLPGKQKWRPQYRYGQITGVSKYNGAADPPQTATVSLLTSASSQQGLGINQDGVLYNVPAQYMECDLGAFKTGDTVLVEFTGRDWADPVIIGFKTNPAKCTAKYVAKVSLVFRGPINFYETGTPLYKISREHTRASYMDEMTDEMFFLWDVINNKPFKVEGAQLPGKTDDMWPIFLEQIGGGGNISALPNNTLWYKQLHSANPLASYSHPWEEWFDAMPCDSCNLKGERTSWCSGLVVSSFYGLNLMGSAPWDHLEPVSTWVDGNFMAGYAPYLAEGPTSYRTWSYPFVPYPKDHYNWNYNDDGPDPFGEAIPQLPIYGRTNCSSDHRAAMYASETIIPPGKTLPLSYSDPPERWWWIDSPHAPYVSVTGTYNLTVDNEDDAPWDWVDDGRYNSEKEYTGTGSMYIWMPKLHQGAWELDYSQSWSHLPTFQVLYAQMFYLRGRFGEWYADDATNLIIPIGLKAPAIPAWSDYDGSYLWEGNDGTFAIYCNADDSIRYFTIDMKGTIPNHENVFQSKWHLWCGGTSESKKYTGSYWCKHTDSRTGEYIYTFQSLQDLSSPLGGQWVCNTSMTYHLEYSQMGLYKNFGAPDDEEWMDHAPSWYEGNDTVMENGSPYADINLVTHEMEFYPGIIKGVWLDVDIGETHEIKLQFGINHVMVNKFIYTSKGTNPDNYGDCYLSTGTYPRLNKNCTTTKDSIHLVEAICGQPESPSTSNPFTSGDPGTGQNGALAAQVQVLLNEAYVAYGEHQTIPDGWPPPFRLHSVWYEEGLESYPWIPKFDFILYKLPQNISVG